MNDIMCWCRYGPVSHEVKFPTITFKQQSSFILSQKSRKFSVVYCSITGGAIITAYTAK